MFLAKPKNTNTSRLPSKWQSERNAKFLVSEADGVTITANPQERMTAMANEGLPVGSDVLCYFEIAVINLPEQSIVAIGLAEKSFPSTKRQPGWEPRSYGYHSDDGGYFNGSAKAAHNTWPTWKQGDVVGCGVNSNRDLYFTLNGVYLGIAESPLPAQELFPLVGFKGPSVIKANFGSSQFAFNSSSPAVFKPGQSTHISDIPVELIQHIFSYVGNVKSLVLIGAVSKNWHELAAANEIWQPLFLRQWPYQKSDLKIKSWAKFYKSRLVHTKKFGPDSHPIENCHFQFKCPLHWEGMTSIIASDNTRHCDKCEREVHWVSTQEELRAAATKGWCVSFGVPDWAENTDGSDTWEGDVDPDSWYANEKDTEVDYLEIEDDF